MKRIAVLTVSFVLALTVFSDDIQQTNSTLVISAGAELDTHLPTVITPVLREALRRLGYSLQVIYNPSPRSLLYSNFGVVDGELYRIYNFDTVTKGNYPNLYRINSSVATIYLSAFSVQEDIQVSNYSDLISYSVAHKRGKKILEKILPYYVNTEKLFLATTEKEAFHMLADGLVDIVITEKMTGMKMLSRHQEFKEIGLAGVLQELTMHTFLNIKHRDLADHLSEALYIMKTDGSFKEISVEAHQQYISPDNKFNLEP